MTKSSGVPLFIVLFLLTTEVNQTFAGCTQAPAAVIKLLEAELSIKAGKLIQSTARMNKSKDFQNIYFIAAEIQGKGKEDLGDIGLWASNSPEAGKGMILSINSLAAKTSNWPHGRKSPLKLSRKNKGARKTITCVKNASKR